mmetsp:Transcript_931/g.1404  ORF Transcript_931/g.1404 Transcript_931/m.1404 type:complete len:233 (-) Transcript_931:38-736(-)
MLFNFSSYLCIASLIHSIACFKIDLGNFIPSRLANNELFSTTAKKFSEIERLTLADREKPYKFDPVSSKKIEGIIAEMENSMIKNPPNFPNDFSTLDGRWLLVYSNNLRAENNSPLALNQVFQVIDTDQNSIKNVAYGIFKVPIFGNEIEIDFCLDHTFEITSQQYPAQLEITLRETKVKNSEELYKKALLTLPAFQSFAKPGRGRFDTTFLSDKLRISRGVYGEVRLFKKV